MEDINVGGDLMGTTKDVTGNPSNATVKTTPKIGNELSSDDAFGSGKEVTWEDKAKSFQSRYDKSQAEIEKLKSQLKSQKEATTFVEALYTDDEIFNAFVADRKPELIKPKDPQDFVKENLDKEFGEDFIPDDDLKDDPRSKTWFYYERAKELYREAREQKKVPEGLKSLKSKREQAKAEQAAQAAAEREKLIKGMGWDESQYNGFVNWASNLTAENLAQEYLKNLDKVQQPQTRPLGLAGTPGGSPQENTDAYYKHLDEMFG